MAFVHKQEILIRDLSTRAVTLYPARAHIVRDINDVVLKDGANEIEIYGLTPTADEHSVKVDGTGSATITDMTVDLVPNREIFEDVYDEESDEESSDSDDDDGSDSERDSDEVKKLKKELEELQGQRTDLAEKAQSAVNRLNVLHEYSKAFTPENTTPQVLEEGLVIYREQRKLAFDEREASGKKQLELTTAIAKKDTELRKASKESRKEKEKRLKLKKKESEKRARQKDEKRKEAARVKAEREKFWPKKVYRVVLHLETTNMDTPGSSRRNSMDSVELAKDVATKSNSTDKLPERTISLALSYVTYEASWSPRYEINILTPSKSGSITYRAEFSNKTSETWKDAKVSLSTSQTSYQGLGDAVPYMHPWHIHLQKGYYGGDNSVSQAETLARSAIKGSSADKSVQRADLFGVQAKSLQSQKKEYISSQYCPLLPSKANRLSARKRSSAAQPQQQGQMAPGAPAPASAAAHAAHYSPQAFQSSHTQMMTRRLGGAAARQEDESVTISFGGGPASNRGYDPTIEDAATLYPTATPIEFEESTWEDYGMTATYDVPGTRTLAPSSLTRRHKIATLAISNLIMTSICVPKLRTAAFLRARFRNPSTTITLLPGTAGLSLDGSFLGNAPFPRVSPTELVTLPLGVDPALHVSYAKPTVHRTTQGLFAKEKAQSFARSLWLTNTRPTPVELLVLDQVPVSDDERLRVDLQVPRGLNKEGDTVAAGEAAKKLAPGEKWGKASATLKKGGEVAWNVRLEKGQACRLALEYEARAPAGESIATA